MRRSILLLFAAAFFLEALVIMITQYPQPTPALPPAATTAETPLITPHQPQPMNFAAPPADQTAVFGQPSGGGSAASALLAVLYSALAGFILGYVNYG